MSAYEAAQAAARKAHEALYYRGTCDVIEYQDVTDPDTMLTHQEEVTVLEGKPCNLSFNSKSAADQTETTDDIDQSLELFIAPEVKIKPGSKIVVTQCGETNEYAMSGKPAMYGGHQEIMLKLFEGWA